jgi:hypothetical protein
MCHPNAGALCLGAPHRLLMSHAELGMSTQMPATLTYGDTCAPASISAASGSASSIATKVCLTSQTERFILSAHLHQGHT